MKGFYTQQTRYLSCAGSMYVLIIVQIYLTLNIPLNYLNFHPLEVVSRYRDPQPQVIEFIHMCLI